MALPDWFDFEIPSNFWYSFGPIIAVLAYIYNFYVKMTCGEFKEIVDNLNDKVILITGANSGLGKETAKYMAKKGAKIIMACRNMKLGEEAKDEIIAYSENTKITLLELDLGSFDSIRKFATKVIETEPKIDILIHNAGYCGLFKKSQTVENIETTMAVNCYGNFLLTHLLIDLMKKSAPSKIVMVSSRAHQFANFDPKNSFHVNPVDFWCPLYLYTNSKFANFLLTYELAKRLDGSGVTANILHPGTCDSPMWDKNTPWYLKFLVSIIKKFLKTTQQGIQTILYVSLSKNVKGVSGKYFRDCEEQKSSKNTYNEELQKIMWEEAKKIVKITPNDPQI